jgi:hypothetical protein
MSRASPAEILLHDPMHNSRIALLELEGDSEGNISPMMKDTGVVPELHVAGIDCGARAFFCQEIARAENVGDEHGALSFGLRLEKVQVLPDCAANGAGYSHVMLEAGPSALDSLRDEIGHDSTAFDPKGTGVGEAEVAGAISDYKSAESLVTHEYVGAKPEDEIRNLEFTGSKDSGCQVVR